MDRDMFLFCAAMSEKWGRSRWVLKIPYQYVDEIPQGELIWCRTCTVEFGLSRPLLDYQQLRVASGYDFDHALWCISLFRHREPPFATGSLLNPEERNVPSLWRVDSTTGTALRGVDLFRFFPQLDKRSVEKLFDDRMTPTLISTSSKTKNCGTRVDQLTRKFGWFHII